MTITLNGTTGITTPAETVQGDLTTTGNTVLGDASTDTLNVANGSLIKDSSGNLGIGVTPSAWNTTTNLQIKNSSFSGYTSGTSHFAYVGSNWYYNSGDKYIADGLASLYIQNAGTHKWYNAPSGTAGATATLTQAMTLDSSGNLLVGATSTQGFSGVNADSAFVGTTGNGRWITGFKNTGNSTPWGVPIAYTAASPNNTSQYFLWCEDGSGTLRFGVRSNGGVANYSANNVNLSDAREKTNVELASSYLDKICAIPVKTFNYIDQNIEEDDGLTLGVIAQDVQAVAPELVMESNWGSEEEPKMRLSIYQTDLQYALMKCIQEQQAIITDLKARIETLENK